ncbi:MAG: shikimate dehydrogenase [Nanoarchaeota archaeon]|nr:shikimate dehydrogenase [Nanoarchaeota archaeon]
MTKICISIVAETVESIYEKTKTALRLADLVEVRLDHVRDIKKEDIIKILVKSPENIIVACRSISCGGNYGGDEESRMALLFEAIERGAGYIDIEIESSKQDVMEIISKAKERKTKIILSHHDFKKTPKFNELQKSYDEMNSFQPDMIKIATFAESINDCFKIFELLKGKENFIAIAMGVRGWMTRILAQKYGSAITYASLEPGNASAPGQITFDELVNLYDFKGQNKDTKVLGVIGEHAENSKSKFLHNPNFRRLGLNYVYFPMKVRPSELAEFMHNFRMLGFAGSAVTVPHKEKIVDFIDGLDETAEKIGATNTLVVREEKILGFNTDYIGALEALKEKTSLQSKKALVIGAGGAARAIIYALKKEGCEITIVNRTLDKAKALAEEFETDCDEISELRQLIRKSDIIINTTSVGMNQNPEESLVPEEFFTGKQIVMDIVYNPIETKLIRYARIRGCQTITGDRMLMYQAIGQFKHWTGKNLDIDQINEDAKKLLE